MSFLTSAVILCTALLLNGAYAQYVQLSQPVVQLPQYKYGYEFGDGLGMSQYHHESADGAGSVKGSYGYQDNIGVYRNVEYTADADGFKPIIKSNEPGLSNHIAADAPYIVQSPPPAAVLQGLRPVRIIPFAHLK
ncbi:cuticle protein 10.9-like [Argiope bruennichi]|uniref:Adult-specific rigid cuticular protein 15.7 like protein n=1 Tax=Argiope bruennichi TaxID=94029 RepID=A0A8T0E5S1_ARGBR|nr:cuticle protein 10.9-like [Argiope bruennichi]KAF8767189.1 Adult-specific rigid cuticular protein 15.7 like protein [Argiope bruennichi]